MHILRSNLIFLAIVSTGLLSSCQDKISTVGTGFYSDTIEFRTSIRQDTGFMKFGSVVRPSVPVLDTSYNLTWASPMMIVGRAASANENLESWGVLQFPALESDDTINRIVGIRLLLRNIPFKYGDTSSNKIDVQVLEAAPATPPKVVYSTTHLSKADLNPTPIGSLQQDGFHDSTDNLLAIAIDTAVKKDLRATSLAYVIVPGPSMTNARGFATSENALVDAGSIPQIEYTVRTDTGLAKIYRPTVLDMHIVNDQSITPPGEFSLRGGAGVRDSIRFILTRPSDSAQLSAFSTINGAVLVLKLDPANSAHSNLAVDTAGPSIVELTGTNDTGGLLWTIGYHDPQDPTILRFQVRTLLEYWLRNPAQNFGLELRAGFVRRVFATSYLGVEDNTINRWTFYGQDCPDVTKRPQLILSYSKLHQ